MDLLFRFDLMYSNFEHDSGTGTVGKKKIHYAATIYARTSSQLCLRVLNAASLSHSKISFYRCACPSERIAYMPAPLEKPLQSHSRQYNDSTLTMTVCCLLCTLAADVLVCHRHSKGNSFNLIFHCIYSLSAFDCVRFISCLYS